MKDRFTELILEKESIAGAVVFVSDFIGVELRYCPYNSSDEQNIDNLEQLIYTTDMRSVKNMMGYIDENM